MRKILTLGVILPLFAFALAIVAPAPESSAADKVQKTQTTMTIKKNPEKSTVTIKKKRTSTTFYNFTAQAGDTYSQMARKAVQAYAKKNNLKISQAGIIFAETNLTNLAGSPEIEVGQTINIKKSDVKVWAKKATSLTKAEQAAWQSYVPYVDFDTSRVGVAS